MLTNLNTMIFAYPTRKTKSNDTFIYTGTCIPTKSVLLECFQGARIN